MTARFLSGRGRRAEGFRYRVLRCEDAMMATARPEKVTLRSTDRSSRVLGAMMRLWPRED